MRHFLAKAAAPVAFIACLLLSALTVADSFLLDRLANDFSVYWRTANQPAELAYQWQGRFPFPYAPTMLLWIRPLALVPMWPAYAAFALASTAALVLACRRHLPRQAVALTLVSPAFARGLFTGQVSALLAAAMIRACDSERRVAAGIAFGLIATIKPQLVLLAPLMFIFQRDWRAFIGAGAAFAVTVLLTLAIFGPERWSEWIASMDHFHRAVAGTNVIKGGITPTIVAEKFGLPPLPFMIAGAAAGVALAWFSRAAAPLAQAAAIAAGSLLASPYALIYDLLPIVPFLALAATRGRFLAALALLAKLQPAPLALAAYELWRARAETCASRTADS